MFLAGQARHQIVSKLSCVSLAEGQSECKNPNSQKETIAAAQTRQQESASAASVSRSLLRKDLDIMKEERSYVCYNMFLQGLNQGRHLPTTPGSRYL